MVVVLCVITADGRKTEYLLRERCNLLLHDEIFLINYNYQSEVEMR